MARISITLSKKRKPTAQGYPLYFNIRYQGHQHLRATGYHAAEKDWNARKSELRASHPGGKRLQVYLQQRLIELQQQLQTAEAQGLPFTTAWERPSGLPTFSAYAREVMERQREAGELGNWRVYQAALKRLEDWHGGPVAMDQISYPVLRRFLAYLDGRGYAFGTIRHIFSTLKAIYNEAARTYPDQLGGDPFAGLLKGRRPQARSQRKPRHLDQDTIRRLARLDGLTRSQRLAVDAWLLAFCLQGAGNIDVIYFQAALIDAEGYYPLQRLKMPRKNIVVRVKLQGLAATLVERYRALGHRYLLGLVDTPRNDTRLLRGKLPEGSRQFENARYRLTKRLQNVSRIMGLNYNITMGQARHSWVVAAREAGASKELVQQAIGHQAQDVLSQHYWGAYDQERVDALNAKVLAAY